MAEPQEISPSSDLPKALFRFFWDVDPASLSWAEHRDFIVLRLLTAGDLDAYRWIRAGLGDEGLRSWLLSRRGKGLDARRLRFWEIVLDLPAEEVSDWVKESQSGVWQKRSGADVPHRGA